MSLDPLSLRIDCLREHHLFLARLARGLVRDEHAAEDLVQDTWLAACQRAERSPRARRGSMWPPPARRRGTDRSAPSTSIAR